MTALTEKESNWVAGLAGRLRLVQADSSAFTRQQRIEYINEELARNLKDVPAASRRRYLDALLAQFPTGQAREAIAPQAPAPPPIAPTPPPPEPETFEQLLERFVATAKAMSEPHRAEIAKRLMDERLVWVDSKVLVLEINDELRQALGLPSDQQLNLRHVVQLCISLVEMLQRLDQTALKTMRDLSPNTAVPKRPQDFRSASAQYLSGQSESIEPALQLVSGLIGAMLAAMLGGPKEFGTQYVGRMSPGAIEDVVIAQGGGSIFGKSKKERCWEHYTLLSKDLETPDLVERKVRDSLGAFARRIMEGRRPR